MKSEHPVRDGTVATVLGGLILAGLGKVSGVVPQGWDFGALAVRALWNLLAYRIELAVPVWACILAIAAAVGVAGLVVWIRRALADAETATDSLPELDEVESWAMQALARYDGGRVSVSTLARESGVAALRLDRAIERLEREKLVTLHQNYMHGTMLTPTRRGRDLLLTRGWVR